MKTRWKKLAAIAATCVMASTAVMGVAACGKKDGSDGTYTYNLAANSLPTSWNIHTYQSNDATYVLDYTEDGLYTFDYNDTKDGYKIVPAMAVGEPEDVTSTYAGDSKWGISSGDTWKAIRVKLRHDLKFDNGKEIKAGDFTKSIELLLNPDAANYRADSLYGGQFSVVNAESYVKGGQTVLEDATGGQGVLLNDGGASDWGNVSADLASKYIFDLSNSYVAKWAAKNYSSYDVSFVFSRLFAEEATEDDVKDLNGKTLAEILASDKLTATLEDILAGWCTDPGEEFGFFCVKVTYPEVDFTNVGVKAVDDYTLDFILEDSLSGFYLKYNLASSFYLVDTALYESCVSTSQGAYTNSYGTSVDTYTGFGPYKLTSYVADSVLKFEKNPYWYGYNDDANKDRYQTTNISISQVSDANTRLQLFLSGALDSYGLQAVDMADYQASDYTYYTEGDSTWFVALNPDYSGLASAQKAATPSASGKVVNKTILTVKEFRQALSFSIDRAAYELALDPTGSVAKALYGNMIISDPDNGTAYRTTDEAKQVIVDFWGLSDDIGAGKEYATIDDAIAAITGYDLAGAQASFKKAYDIAVEQGLIDPNTDWEVQIVIGQPGSGSSAYYNDGYDFLSRAWTAAVEGTPFQGRLVFTQSEPLGSTGFSDYLKNNQIDLLFGVGWTGSVLDPYSLMEAYVSPNYQYDPGWDTTATSLDITIDGKVLRASVYDWGYAALQGKTITAQVISNGTATGETVSISAGPNDDASVRLMILAAVEGAVLNQYDMIPVGSEASASLKGMRIKFYTEEYVFGMGRGGIKYMTYTMNDADWAKYISDHGGTLNYK